MVDVAGYGLPGELRHAAAQIADPRSLVPSTTRTTVAIRPASWASACCRHGGGQAPPIGRDECDGPRPTCPRGGQQPPGTRHSERHGPRPTCPRGSQQPPGTRHSERNGPRPTCPHGRGDDLPGGSPRCISHPPRLTPVMRPLTPLSDRPCDQSTIRAVRASNVSCPWATPSTCTSHRRAQAEALLLPPAALFLRC
jgi:hypothetical protein